MAIGGFFLAGFPNSDGEEPLVAGWPREGTLSQLEEPAISRLTPDVRQANY
jgi:hypothetical protein